MYNLIFFQFESKENTWEKGDKLLFSKVLHNYKKKPAFSGQCKVCHNIEIHLS